MGFVRKQVCINHINQSIDDEMNLYSLKMEDERNVFDYINKFNELVSRIMNAGEDIKDEEHALFLLASLLKSYKSLMQ